MPASPLARVLVAKIVLTVVAWCVPLLLFPVGLLERLGLPAPEPAFFLRLLGMAYTALVVGYAFGLHACLRGEYPVGVVWMGIASNGGACLALAAAALAGAWSDWDAPARLLMWSSLVGTGAITAGLVAFGPFRAGAPDSEAGAGRSPAA